MLKPPEKIYADEPSSLLETGEAPKSAGASTSPGQDKAYIPFEEVKDNPAAQAASAPLVEPATPLGMAPPIAPAAPFKKSWLSNAFSAAAKNKGKVIAAGALLATAAFLFPHHPWSTGVGILAGGAFFASSAKHSNNPLRSFFSGAVGLGIPVLTSRLGESAVDFVRAHPMETAFTGLSALVIGKAASKLFRNSWAGAATGIAGGIGITALAEKMYDMRDSAAGQLPGLFDRPWHDEKEMLIAGGVCALVPIAWNMLKGRSDRSRPWLATKMVAFGLAGVIGDGMVKDAREGHLHVNSATTIPYTPPAHSDDTKTYVLPDHQQNQSNSEATKSDPFHPRHHHIVVAP